MEPTPYPGRTSIVSVAPSDVSSVVTAGTRARRGNEQMPPTAVAATTNASFVTVPPVNAPPSLGVTNFTAALS